MQKPGGVWICFPGLAGAAAALILPGATSTAAAGAALLAVGALAMLAGHTWGLMVSVPSHLTIVGQLWPSLALAHHGTPVRAAAGAIVLVTALPALALTAVVLPQMARHLLADALPRTRRLFVAGAALALAAAVILPAVWLSL